jgi:hypothetical protein
MPKSKMQLNYKCIFSIGPISTHVLNTKDAHKHTKTQARHTTILYWPIMFLSLDLIQTVKQQHYRIKTNILPCVCFSTPHKALAVF